MILKEALATNADPSDEAFRLVTLHSDVLF